MCKNKLKNYKVFNQNFKNLIEKVISRAFSLFSALISIDTGAGERHQYTLLRSFTCFSTNLIKSAILCGRCYIVVAFPFRSCPVQLQFSSLPASALDRFLLQSSLLFTRLRGQSKFGLYRTFSLLVFSRFRLFFVSAVIHFLVGYSLHRVVIHSFLNL